MKTIVVIALSLSVGLGIPSSSAQAGIMNFIFGTGKQGKQEEGLANCRNFFKKVADNNQLEKNRAWQTRLITDEKPKLILNDLDYLREKKISDLLGSVRTERGSYNTRFYFTTTAKPRPNGTLPWIDKEAKAIVIFFHGTGRENAGGAMFTGKMNALAKLGYSALSFDLPFSQAGMKNKDFVDVADSKRFADYLYRLLDFVQSEKANGQPIFLVGNGTSADIISEYITRHPHAANGAILISPASLDEMKGSLSHEKKYKRYFEDANEKQKEDWVTQLKIGSTWNDPKASGRVDPTIANPNLKVFVISGDGQNIKTPRDVDVGAVYRPLFKNLQVTLEPGLGKNILGHKDPQGQDVIMRSILSANGESILDENEIKRAMRQKQIPRTPVEQMITRYWRDRFFREWLDLVAQKKGVNAVNMLEQMNTLDAINARRTVEALEEAFNAVVKWRESGLLAHIGGTSNWAPEFYHENKALIDQAEKKNAAAFKKLQEKYLNFLETQNQEVIAKHTMSDPTMTIRFLNSRDELTLTR